jgi:poly(A) polymerase Pap1
MIKIKFAKFILLFTLALVSINSCFPSDYECADNEEFKVLEKITSTSNEHDSSAKNTTSNSTEKETHYCLCSLTCHTMFINLEVTKNLSVYFLDFSKEFEYTAQNYPQVTYSLEKPPTV